MLEELKKIGLSENEAKIYLALLELGSSTVQKIGEKAGTKRPTAYVQLESLMNQGLVTTFEKGKKTLFRAEDPEYLKKVIEKNKKRITEEEHALDAVLPGLEKLFLAAGERPRVRFFEGIEGLRTMQKECLRVDKNSRLEVIYSRDDLLKLLPANLEDYTKKRVARNIRSRMIYTSSKGSELKATDKEMLRESRYIPKEKFPLSCDITLYGDTVALAALREKPIGILIESKEIANSLKTVFALAWEAAEKYQI